MGEDGRDQLGLVGFGDLSPDVRVRKGLSIVITELDVKEHIYTLSADERDKRVGELVTDYLDVALAQPAVKGVITWD